MKLRAKVRSLKKDGMTYEASGDCRFRVLGLREYSIEIDTVGFVMDFCFIKENQMDIEGKRDRTWDFVGIYKGKRRGLRVDLLVVSRKWRNGFS